MTGQKAIEYMTPPGAPKAVAGGTYSYGVKVKPGASFIFVSGLGPVDDKGKGLVGFDIYTQTCQVMDNIKKVLEEAGATMDDVVIAHISVPDHIWKNWERYTDAYNTYFKQCPAAVLAGGPIFVHGHGQLIQIDVVAAI